jgi:hypothetical protein
LIFKGVEIFQIAYMSNREDRTGGLIVGIGAMGAAGIFFALIFAIWITTIAADVPCRDCRDEQHTITPLPGIAFESQKLVANLWTEFAAHRSEALATNGKELQNP